MEGEQAGLQATGVWRPLSRRFRNLGEKMIQESGLVLVEDSMRSELCAETDDIQQSSSDCRLWVVQRQDDVLAE